MLTLLYPSYLLYPDKDKNFTDSNVTEIYILHKLLYVYIYITRLLYYCPKTLVDRLLQQISQDKIVGG